MQHAKMQQCADEAGADATSWTLQAAFLCCVPSGCFATMFLCALELGWF